MPARRRWRILTVMVVIAAALAYLSVPYVRAASLFVRVARVGGHVEEFAARHARAVTVLRRTWYRCAAEWSPRSSTALTAAFRAAPS